nr:DoxX family membrane protein [Actinomadura sp. CNU-125]
MPQQNENRRDGLDLARLLLRTAVGGTMIAHGVKHGRTLDGTAGWFESIGFRQHRLQAQLSAAIEVGAGAALVAGAGTPLAASAVVGTMGVAARTVHQPNGFFITAEGYEYVLNLAVATTALAALGPGRYSVDSALGLDRGCAAAAPPPWRPVVGLAGAAAQLAAFWRRPPPRRRCPPRSRGRRRRRPGDAVMPDHVVVVGAGVGALRMIERLRADGHEGRITLIGAERHDPYDRPPLSKQILTGDWEPGRATLRDGAGLAELDVTARLGTRAVALRGTTVELDDGGSVAGDAVVLATASSPAACPASRTAYRPCAPSTTPWRCARRSTPPVR